MRKSNRLRLDRLLSGTVGPSPNERAEIFKAVVRRATASPLRLRWPALRWLVPAGALATVLTLVLLVVPDRVQTRGEFNSRGGAVAALELSCGDARSNGPAGWHELTCPRGSTMSFALRAPRGMRYFSAAALGTDGLYVRYFPAGAAETSLALDDRAVASRGIVLGDEHVAGRYRVFGFFSTMPLTQKRVRALVEVAATGGNIDLPFVSATFTVVR